MSDAADCIVVSPFFQTSSSSDVSIANDTTETDVNPTSCKDRTESYNSQINPGGESESCNSQEYSQDENEPCSSQENPKIISSQSEVDTKFSPRYARRPGKRYSAVKKKPGRRKEVKSPYFTVDIDSPNSLKYEKERRVRDKWIPPRSPYALIQEDLFDNPWQLLIATIFLTKTRAQLAIPPLHKFLAKWPTPESLLEADFDEIHEILKPLGLGMLRSRSVLRFTKEFLEKDWQYPIELHGIGKYGNDSYRMFCVNEWRDVAPTDIPLSMYKEWLTINEEKLGLQ